MAHQILFNYLYNHYVFHYQSGEIYYNSQHNLRWSYLLAVEWAGTADGTYPVDGLFMSLNDGVSSESESTWGGGGGEVGGEDKRPLKGTHPPIYQLPILILLNVLLFRSAFDENFGLQTLLPNF